MDLTEQQVRYIQEWAERTGVVEELSDALILKVMLKQYNSPADDTVRRYCDEFSVVLFPR